jgi:TolB-like protein
MELLTGETLAKRLQHGPIPLDEARPLVEQMAAGLAAAHARGIIHRDFKSINVILEEGRAVITDFGLARVADLGDGKSITGGGLIGTPAYMAPEQVEGGTVGAAADIYALGVVMYEMVTGRVPFLGENPLATAMMRLKQPPTPPSTHVPGLDPRWERVILRCLARDPKDRFASALDVARALDGEPVGPRRGWILPAAAAGVVAAAAVAFLALRPHGAPASGPNAGAGPKRIAVLGFKNLTQRPEAAWISTALGELLDAELDAGAALRSVPGEEVGRARQALALADADSYGVETLHKLHDATGADYVIVGSYLADGGGRLRLDLRLMDAGTGETLKVVTEDGREAQLIDAAKHGGAELRRVLVPSSVADDQKMRFALPTNEEAARFYSEGLDADRRNDCGHALPAFEKTVATDPMFLRGRVHLMWALWCTGYSKRGQEEARHALELAASPEVPARERLTVAATAAFLDEDYGKMEAIYRQLYDEDPQLEYAAGLFEAYHFQQKYADGRALLEAVKKLPSASIDARFGVYEYNILRGEHRDEEAYALAERVIADAKEKHQPEVAEDMQARVASLLLNESRAEEALANAQAALAGATRSGDRDGVADMKLIISAALLKEGRLAEGLAMAEEGSAIAEEIGDLRRLRPILYYTARILLLRGRIPEATAACNRLRKLSAAAQDAWVLGRAAMCEVFLSLSEGDLPGARRAAQEVLGQRSQREPGERGEIYQVKVDATAGDLVAARAQLKTIPFKPDNQVDQALIEQDGDDPAAAEGAARVCIQKRESTKLVDELDVCRALLAMALLREGKTADAAAALPAEARIAGTEDVTVRPYLAEAIARVRAAGGKADAVAAVKLVEPVVTELHGLGYRYFEARTRLALGEVQLLAGDPAGRGTLQAALAQSHELGFAAIEARAQAALARH